jgi:hypothetical protein
MSGSQLQFVQRFGEMVLQVSWSGTGYSLHMACGVSTWFFRGLVGMVGAVAMTRRSKRSEVRADSPLGKHTFALKMLRGSKLQDDNMWSSGS